MGRKSVVILIIFLMGALVPGVSAVWSDNYATWQYRMPILVTNPTNTTLVAPVINVTLDSTFPWTHVESNGADIRFADENGNPLSYRILTWNYTHSATILVRAPDIPAGGTITIYMYYGAQGVTDMSNSTVNTTTANATVQFGSEQTPVRNVAVMMTVSQNYEKITATIVVKNTGNVLLSNVSLLVNVTGPATYTKTYTIPTLASGASQTIVFEYTPPTAGQYTLKAKADPDNHIAEVDENDNEASATVYFVRGRYLQWGNVTLWLVDEYASDLSQITLTYLDSSMNTLGNTIVSSSTQRITIPSSASYLVFRSDTVERYIYLPGLSVSTLAFPSTAETTDIRTAQVYIFNRDIYDVLTVKTIDGKIVARYNLKDFSDISFTGVVGRTYLFQLEQNGEVKYSQSVTITNSLEYITIVPPGSKSQKKVNITIATINIDATYDSGHKVISGKLTSSEAVSGIVRIELYGGENNTLISQAIVANFTNRTSVDFVYPLSDNTTKFAYARIIAQTSAGEFVRTIMGAKGVGGLMPQSYLPNGIRIIIVGALGLFALVRANIELSATLTALMLTLARLIGFIQISDSYLALIYGLAASMFLFTRIQGKE